MSRQAHRGIVTDQDGWLDDLLSQVRPGDHFVADRTTVRSIRSGEWYISKLGVHGTYEEWQAAGRRGLMNEVREKVETILATHEPLPLDEDVERELARIEERARESS